MTKKRFRVEKQIFDGYCIVDNTVDGYYAYEKQDLQRLCDSLNELADENEQLKATIKEVIELLSDEVDVFSDKATEHNIIAYIELNELDNKDAYYMATATKKAIRILKELQK